MHHPPGLGGAPEAAQRAGGTGEVRLRNRVKSLRMRPSGVSVGDVRTDERLDLLLSLNAGLRGMLHDPRQRRARR